MRSLRSRSSATARPSVTVALLAMVALPVTAGSTGTTNATCQAQSTAAPPIVVELYTSEGCSSCPPADRWLSSLSGRTGVLPLGFHVDYWDRLGWTDRFASRAATERQYHLARIAGAGNVYTPQVLANGQEWRRWPSLPSPATAPGPALTLLRHGNEVTAEIDAHPSAARLSGYWAVLEDGYASRITAGENAGETLRHDHVVRLYRAVDTWDATLPHRETLSVLPGSPEHPRRSVFVVTDPASLRPLQALALPLLPGAGC